MDRQIVHLDLDSFFVSVEVLKNAVLKGKPVIIGGTGDRGVVASCSYEARKYGVHSAMPTGMARRLCPDAFFLKGNMDEYSKYSAVVTEILQERAPLIEKASIDEHYIDVSGMDRFIGCLKFTQELKSRVIRETGLPISFGLSVNKTVAKVATGEGKPDGSMLVGKSQVQPFLNPLGVHKIPGVGEKTSHKLNQMGVSLIRTLCEVNPEQLQQVFGKPGLLLSERAHGIDHSPVVAYQERKSMSTEQTFHTDTTNITLLTDTLTRMVMELTYQLRKEKRVTACLNIKLRYSDFETVNKQVNIPYTSMDDVLILKTHEMFTSLFNKRKLIRLIGVKFTKLISGHQQIDLFDTASHRIQLYQAMDRIKSRFGEQYITLATAMNAKE